MPTSGDCDATTLTALFPDLTNEQADGLACIVCRTDFATSTTPSVPVGRSATTLAQVFACTQPCAPAVGYAPPAGDQLALGEAVA